MNITAIISVIIACGSLIFVAINYGTGRHDKSGAEMEAVKESLLKANMKLDQLCGITTSIQTDIKAMNVRVTEVEKQLACMDRDFETVWKRIDELKEGKYLPSDIMRRGDKND